MAKEGHILMLLLVYIVPNSPSCLVVAAKSAVNIELGQLC